MQFPLCVQDYLHLREITNQLRGQWKTLHGRQLYILYFSGIYVLSMSSNEGSSDGLDLTIERKEYKQHFVGKLMEQG